MSTIPLGEFYGENKMEAYFYNNVSYRGDKQRLSLVSQLKRMYDSIVQQENGDIIAYKIIDNQIFTV